jgi:hypothetical protein
MPYEGIRLLPAPDLERSKDRQTKACGITLVIIAIMPIYALSTQLDTFNQQMQQSVAGRCHCRYFCQFPKILK